MAKIKSVSNYNGTSWDTPIPLGADDANIDITSATTDPTTDTTATAAGLIAADVVAGEGDTDATAWTKFNKFRRRVYNAFSGVAGVAVVNSAVSSGGNSKVYSAGYINNYMTNVIGHSGTTTPTDGTIMDQLNTTNQNLNNRVAKDGDTMTGKLINNVAFTNAIIDLDKDVTPEIAKAYDSLEIIDKNSSLISMHRVTHGIDGNVVTTIGTRRYTNSGTVFNTINLGVTLDGEQTVTVNDPAKWRSALGTVNKAGDMMTGNLIISKNGSESDVALKRTDVKLGTAPSADTFFGAVAFYDSADKSCGYVGNFYKTNKYSGARLLARNWNGSTNYSNYVDLLSGQDGSAVISFSHPAAWKAALGMPDGISVTSFLNSWTANGLNFIKRTGNVRHLHLSIRNGTTTSGTTICTVPADKPTVTSIAPIFNLVGLSINGYLNIDTSGNVKINNVTTNTSVVSDLYWLV